MKIPKQDLRQRIVGILHAQNIRWVSIDVTGENVYVTFPALTWVNVALPYLAHANYRLATITSDASPLAMFVPMALRHGEQKGRSSRGPSLHIGLPDDVANDPRA